MLIKKLLENLPLSPAPKPPKKVEFTSGAAVYDLPRCGEVLALVGNPDPRSVAAVEAKRKWMRGEITDRQLEEARDAARDATRDAAEYAAWCAAWCAVRYSARGAAGGAAWCAAWYAARNSAMDAAGDATKYAAECAAWNDTWRKQAQRLRELLGNG